MLKPVIVSVIPHRQFVTSLPSAISAVAGASPWAVYCLPLVPSTNREKVLSASLVVPAHSTQHYDPLVPPGRYVNRSSGQGLSGQGLSGQGLSGQGLSGQGLSGQGLSGQGLSGPGLSGQGLSGQGLSGQGLSVMGRWGMQIIRRVPR